MATLRGLVVLAVGRMPQPGHSCQSQGRVHVNAGFSCYGPKVGFLAAQGRLGCGGAGLSHAHGLRVEKPSHIFADGNSELARPAVLQEPKSAAATLQQ